MDISGFSVEKNLRYLGIPSDSMRDMFIPDPWRSPMVTFWACFFQPSHNVIYRDHQFQHMVFNWVFWWVTKTPKTSTISSPLSHPIRLHWIRKRLSRGRNGGALRICEKSSGTKKNTNTWGWFFFWEKNCQNGEINWLTVYIQLLYDWCRITSTWYL